MLIVARIKGIEKKAFFPLDCGKKIGDLQIVQRTHLLNVYTQSTQRKGIYSYYGLFDKMG